MALFGRKRQISDAVRGTAKVVSSTMPTSNALYTPLRMTLVVQAEGIAPTSVEYRQKAARTKRFPTPGQVIPVEIDRSDVNNLRVLWDEVPTRMEVARNQGDQLAASMRDATGPAPTGSVTDAAPTVHRVVQQLGQAFPGATVNVGSAAAATGSSGGTDRVGALERLAALHRPVCSPTRSSSRRSPASSTATDRLRPIGGRPSHTELPPSLRSGRGADAGG